jgi:hypothetical protein
MLYPRDRDPVPIVEEAGWASGPFWTDAENLITGIRSPNHPVRSESLYRLNYTGPQWETFVYHTIVTQQNVTYELGLPIFI